MWAPWPRVYASNLLTETTSKPKTHLWAGSELPSRPGPSRGLKLNPKVRRLSPPASRRPRDRGPAPALKSRGAGGRGRSAGTGALGSRAAQISATRKERHAFENLIRIPVRFEVLNPFWPRGGRQESPRAAEYRQEEQKLFP